jgi:DNA-binding Lrp family transcriptional regulator
VSKSAPVQNLHRASEIQKSPKSGFLRVPNIVFDEWIPKLTPVEAIVFLRLYRLSIGFNKTMCMVGTATLAKTCNVSENTCRTALRRLIDLKMIRCIQMINSKDLKGTVYEIRPLEQAGDWMESESLKDRSKNHTGAKFQPNTRHDDHEQDTDHHQKNARARAGDDDDDETEEAETAHFADVKRLYQELTGNAWKAADTAAYREIADVPVAEASEALRRVATRSPGRANSFRYFVREIKGGTETGLAEREVTTLVEVAREVRSLNTGRYGYTEAEFREDVKTAAARRGAAYGPRVLEEALRRLVGGRTGG